MTTGAGKNTDMDPEEIIAVLARLEALEERYQEWVLPINTFTRENLYRLGRDGYTQDDFERDRKQITAAQRAKYDPHKEPYAFFDDLCPWYLAASEKVRAAIRKAASDKNGMLHALLGQVYRSADQLRSSSDTKWLRYGLAAASIEDCRKDFRDVALALGELHVAAVEIGVHPRSEFQRVARLSSAEKATGGDR